MGFGHPLSNLKGFATSRPPLMVFTLCVIAFALTTLSLAYLIKNTDSVPNNDAKTDWTTFLNHLSGLDLCVLQEDPIRTVANRSYLQDEPELPDSVGNVSITVTASLSLVEQLCNFPHNMSILSGVLPLGDWSPVCCPEMEGDSSSINVTVSLPPLLNCSLGFNEVCVTFSGPKALLPVTHQGPAICRPPPMLPHGVIGGRLLSRIGTDNLGERWDDDWCHDGTKVKMQYRPIPHLAVMLTLQDRSLINLHLVHTSYFLFVMAMTLICYAVIKGKPKQKTILIEKVLLDP